MWSIHTMEYYSVVKRNEVLIHAPIWMNLENIVLAGIWVGIVLNVQIILGSAGAP